MTEQTSTCSPAKRGDFAVTVQTSRAYALHTGVRHVTRITVGKVVSVSREGRIKKVKPFSIGCDLTPSNWDSIMHIPAAKIRDHVAFAAACEARQSLDADKYNPWSDINDVRATVKRFI